MANIKWTNVFNFWTATYNLIYFKKKGKALTRMIVNVWHRVTIWRWKKWSISETEVKCDGRSILSVQSKRGRLKIRMFNISKVLDQVPSPQPSKVFGINIAGIPSPAQRNCIANILPCRAVSGCYRPSAGEQRTSAQWCTDHGEALPRKLPERGRSSSHNSLMIFCRFDCWILI